MWFLSLVLAGGMGTAAAPPLERVLYPSFAERLQACRTPVPPSTEAELNTARRQAGQRQVWFRPSAQVLQGACAWTDPKYPELVRAAQEFEARLLAEEGPPAPIGVTLWSPIQDFQEVGKWQAWLVLRDGFGKELLRWKPRTGMTRQLVPGMGLSMLIFNPPTEPQRALVQQATALWVEVDWRDGRGVQRYNSASLPER